jgi:hypothetical protein
VKVSLKVGKILLYTIFKADKRLSCGNPTQLAIYTKNAMDIKKDDIIAGKWVE